MSVSSVSCCPARPARGPARPARGPVCPAGPARPARGPASHRCDHYSAFGWMISIPGWPLLYFWAADFYSGVGTTLLLGGQLDAVFS